MTGLNQDWQLLTNHWIIQKMEKRLCCTNQSSEIWDFRIKRLSDKEVNKLFLPMWVGNHPPPARWNSGQCFGFTARRIWIESWDLPVWSLHVLPVHVGVFLWASCFIPQSNNTPHVLNGDSKLSLGRCKCVAPQQSGTYSVYLTFAQLLG